MALTLTYDATLSRVRITATGLATTAETVLVERSTDQVTWSTVRGGLDVPVTAGVSATVDDYEFTDRVPNYYRATVTRSGITLLGVGAAAHAVNASVTPPLPAGWAPGCLLGIWCAIRNRGPGFPIASPAGYTLALDTSNARLFIKQAGAVEVAQQVDFIGGTATSDTSAQMVAFAGASTTVIASAILQNASLQNIPTPALDVPANAGRRLVLTCGWKADDWTSVDPLPGQAEIAEPDTITGDDQGLVWDYVVRTDDADEPAGQFVVTGGAAAISNSGVIAFADQQGEQVTANITPILAGMVLKSLARPFLNRPVTWRLIPEITLPARGGLFRIVGRTLPVAVTSVRGSRQYTLDLLTQTASEADDLRMLLMSGDILYVHTPADCAGGPPTLYAMVGDVTISPAPTGARSGPTLARRYWRLPLTEAAAPGPDVVGSTATWQTVLNTYATWTDVLAAHPTWADLLDLVADPSEVIVP